MSNEKRKSAREKNPIDAPGRNLNKKEEHINSYRNLIFLVLLSIAASVIPHDKSDNGMPIIKPILRVMSVPDINGLYETYPIEVNMEACRKLAKLKLPAKSEYLGNFDPNSYQPPSQGIIWKNKVIAPEKKTIIYIPDQHAKEKEDKDSIRIQKEIFDIIESAIKTYGHAYLVSEGGVQYNDDPEINFKKGLIASAWDDFESIAIESDIETRKKLALKKVGISDIGSCVDYLGAVFQEGLTVIPSHSPEEEVENIGSVFGELIERVIETNISCEFTEVAPYPVGMLEARLRTLNHFDGGKKYSDPTYPIYSDALLDCFCASSELLNMTRKEFVDHRVRKASKLEIEKAITSPLPFVFVVAGCAHLPEAIKIIESHELNYIIVRPKSFSPSSMEGGIKMDEDDIKKILDNFPGAREVCDKINNKRLGAIRKVFEKHLNASQNDVRRYLKDVDQKAKECGIE